MHKVPEQALLKQLWLFAHAELPTPEFEQWLYEKHVDLNNTLDAHLLSDLLEVNYDDARSVGRVRFLLHSYLTELPKECYCLTLKSIDRKGLGHTDEIEFSHVRKRARTSWLHLTQCNKCGCWWYVAADTIDDDVHFQRLTEEQANSVLTSNTWPSTFDALLSKL